MPVYPELPYKEIERLAAAFGKKIDNNVELLSGGSANSNYLIQSAGKKFVLAIAENKSEDQVRTLVNVLNHLEKNGFDTSRCFRTKAGDDMLLHQGKPVILKSFIEGMVPKQITQEQAFVVGQELAKLHAMQPAPGLPDHHDYAVDAFRVLGNETPGHPFLNWLDRMEEYIRSFVNQDLPRRMIHGDVFCDNLVVQGTNVVIMDFEEACYYYRMFDIGMTVLGSCCPDMQLDEVLLQNLLKGYATVEALDPSESNLVLPFTVYAAVATAFWRFRQFNVLTPDEGYQDSYIQMQLIADQIRIKEVAS